MALWRNVRLAGAALRRKPLLALRALGNYARLPFAGDLKPLRFVDVSITHACNFECSHCSEKNLSRVERPLSLEQYRDIARQLQREGALAFHFTGGEPLLSHRLEEILRVFDPPRNFLSVQTNGSLATKERLASLRAAGLDMLCVSVDSGSAAQHDAFRRAPGSFEQCWRAVDSAFAAGLRVGVSTVITHENLHSQALSQLIERTRELGCSLFFNLAVPIGNFQSCSALLLTPEDRRFMEELIRRHPHCRTDFESAYFRRGCPAIKEKCYVTPEGRVIPCPFIHVAMGDLTREPIRQIREQGLRRLPELREYLPLCPAAESAEFHEKYGYGDCESR